MVIGSFHWKLNEDIIVILYNVFHKIEISSDSFYDISLISKPDKNIYKKKYKSIPLRKYVNILNKILSNWIQQCLKGFLHHD